MARMPRAVIPSIPHHITQRGNRRQKTLFCPEDYERYICLIAENKVEAGVDIWAYCLMPNHVHLVAVPDSKRSLSDLFRVTHASYSRAINSRFGWRGHLWQERFHSSAMDTPHTIAAVRYVELNPVRANLCHYPADWQWSSTKAHLDALDDKIVSVDPMLRIISNWERYLGNPNSDQLNEAIRQHGRTGRPMGDNNFIKQLEGILGREILPKKPGPKPKINSDQGRDCSTHNY